MDYEGYLIQGQDSKIYLIINQQRHLISSIEVFDRLFITSNRIEYLDDNEIMFYKEGQPFLENTMLRKDISNDQLYIDDGNQLYECDDEMIYHSGLKWLDYKEIKKRGELL